MLVFFLMCIFIISTILILSTINIKIEDFKFSNYKNIGNNPTIYFQIIIFRFIKILSRKVNIKTIQELYKKEKIDMSKMINLKKDRNISRVVLKSLKIENIKLKLFIGTGNIMLTTYIVAILSIIVSCILPQHIIGDLKDSYYKIAPIYDEELKYEIGLNCIISIKMVHIIHIIYLILKKRRDEKYVRTSNRRPYEGSYE